MPLYFAYGLNMDRTAMAARCPASQPVGIARLPRHRFVITVDGYASAVRDARQDVHGVLWNLALADVPALDRFEGVSRGLYSKAVTSVIAEAGPRRAMVYFASGASPGRPKPGYMDDVIAAAQAFGLPSAYVATLQQWLPGRAPGGLDLSNIKPVAPSRITVRAEAPVSTVTPRRRPPQ